MSRFVIEVSAVREHGDGITTCNDEPLSAKAIGVYIRAPLAFHVQDFELIPLGDEAFAETRTRAQLFETASRAAFRYADALAEHIGGTVGANIPRPVRYAIEPQRNALAGQPAEGGTNFVRCEEARAQVWAVFMLPPGEPGGNGELVEDYPTRAQAEAAQAALERGEPAPKPVRDPLADLAPDLRAWLIDEVGFQPDMRGGGDIILSFGEPHPTLSLLLTGADGSGLPTWDSWMIGAYEAPDDEHAASDPFFDLCSSWGRGAAGNPLTLRMAVAAARGVFDQHPATRNDPAAMLFDHAPGDVALSDDPLRTLDEATALVRDALVLLDCVDDVEIDGPRLSAVARGATVRLSVELWRRGARIA